MLIEKSKEIVLKAISDFKPKAIVMMLSGGDDSVTAYYVSKEIGLEFDFVIHGNTRTGVPETTEFVRSFCEKNNENYLEADAGDAYEKYVLRKGFFGVGETAHNYAYHVLKIQHFRKVVSANLRKRRRNFPILFINGARRDESERRKVTMASPYRRDPAQKNNIWVNIINDWSHHDCLNYLSGNSLKRSPVSINLCRSGECMCGTMQKKSEYEETGFFYPDWKLKMDALRQQVMKKFPWDWGENINEQHLMEMHGQVRIDFQPMCVGCGKRHEDSKKGETHDSNK